MEKLRHVVITSSHPFFPNSHPFLSLIHLLLFSSTPPPPPFFSPGFGLFFFTFLTLLSGIIFPFYPNSHTPFFSQCPPPLSQFLPFSLLQFSSPTLHSKVMFPFSSSFLPLSPFPFLLITAHTSCPLFSRFQLGLFSPSFHPSFTPNSCLLHLPVPTSCLSRLWS